MDPTPQRPWYRLRWLTWAIAITVVGAFVIRQLEKQLIFGLGDLGMYYQRLSIGWPFQYAEVIESGAMAMTGPYSIVPATLSTTYEWFVWPLLANCALGVLLVASTAFVCESWLRQERRLQISLGQMLVGMATVGVLLTLARSWTIGYRELEREDFEMEWSLIDLSDLKNPLRWPVLFALACMIYSSGWLAWICTLRALSSVRRSGS